MAIQLAWAAFFLTEGLYFCALGATYLAACVLYVAYYYSDHAGRVCFVVERHRRAIPTGDESLQLLR